MGRTILSKAPNRPQTVRTPNCRAQLWGRCAWHGAPQDWALKLGGLPTFGRFQAFGRTVRPFGEAFTAA
eukprot:4241495-Alexandrium_andersonii.AAC.1